MKTLDPDEISRIELLQLRNGSAASLEEAQELLAARRLTLYFGDRLGDDGAAAALTAAATGARAFGTVYAVTSHSDPTLTSGVARGSSLTEAVRAEGVRVVEASEDLEHVSPSAIVIGAVNADEAAAVRARHDVVIFANWDSWVAQIAPQPAPPGRANVLAAITAASLAVSEAFLLAADLPGSDAGYRELSIDLLGEHGRSGPDLAFAPASWWLVGLGHLGQAYAWVISHLPYSNPAGVNLVLQDTDRTVPANHSTGVLTPAGSRGIRKTRLVADRVEQAGFTTNLIERRLDQHLRVSAEEAGSVALIGVDNLPTRRLLSGIGWSLVIDLGLGANAHDYTAISLHRFPASQLSHEIPAWQDQPAAPARIPGSLGFVDLERRFDKCGVVALAGKAVGVPFIGMLAATLAVAEAVKKLHSVRGVEVLGFNADGAAVTAAPAVDHTRIPHELLGDGPRRR